MATESATARQVEQVAAKVDKAISSMNQKVDKAVSKMQHYAELAKEEVRAAPGALKSAATPVGVGALLAIVATLDSVKNNEYVKKYWWLLPVAILVVGYYLSRSKDPRKNVHAKTVFAIGGALLVLAYQNRPEAKNATAKAGETGAPYPYQVPYQLHPSENGYGWLQGPNGQLVRVELAPLLRQFGPMLQTTAITAPAQDAAARLAAMAYAA